MLIEDPDAAATVAYVQMVAEREPFNGHYIGVREWPDGRPLIEQPAAVVEAMYTVLGHLQQLQQPPERPGEKKTADGPPRP